MGAFDAPRPGSALSSASSGDEPDDMWSSMLKSVASSKRLPQKSVLVLGGNAENQREFVEALGAGSTKKGDKKPPVANEFALGYTYQDVLDADHEDVLARLGVYLISEPTPAFVPLLRPLFTPVTLPEMLVVVLLDWARPWTWMREMRTWVRLLRGIFTKLDDECRMTLDEVTQAWEARRNRFADGGGDLGDVQIPLGPGEYDEPVGLPLCVVCQNADKIETLERERGWREEEFDFVSQFLRTILLKHGASLIYTTPSAPSSLQPLIYSSLSIQSPLRQQTLKHNVIERDKVLVPAGWDSWGKIRVLREGFDVEGINSGWTIDISEHSPPDPSFLDQLTANVEGGAVEIYEDVIPDPKLKHADASADILKSSSARALETPPVSTQDFLATQMEILEAKAAEEKAAAKKEGASARGLPNVADPAAAERVTEHVGPVQFNVGGIQVDADYTLERLKERDSQRADASDQSPGGGPAPPPVDGKSQNEVLNAFFSSLMKKNKGGGGKGA